MILSFLGSPYRRSSIPRIAGVILEKHGKKEFGFETEAEYTKAVNDFWSRELSEIVQEIERKDGVRERYDFSTNEFSIIDKNGRVKTYFLPKRKGDYWKDEIRDKAILLNGRPIN